jgi:pyrroline-5-carboxylate reductase
LASAVELFASLGRTAVLDESLMDAATGLSGCGPAYVFLIIEALAEAGVKLGINRATSTLLATQTLLGSAQLVLQRGVHPAELKDEVTTPGGCTIDGLVALEEGGLRSTLISGVMAAANRSRTLRTGL